MPSVEGQLNRLTRRGTTVGNDASAVRRRMVIVSASRKPPLAVCEVTVVVVEPVVTFPRRAAASINANGPSVGTAGAWPYSTLDSAGEPRFALRESSGRAPQLSGCGVSSGSSAPLPCPLISCCDANGGPVAVYSRGYALTLAANLCNMDLAAGKVLVNGRTDVPALRSVRLSVAPRRVRSVVSVA